MKLYDYLLAAPRLFAGGETTPEADAGMRRLLAEATRYKIDSIAEYYWTHPDTENAWYLDDPEYFPSLKPPGPVVWMEYRMPKRILLGDDKKPRYNPMQGDQVAGLLNVLFRDNEQHRHNFDGFSDDAVWIIQLFFYRLSRDGQHFDQGDSCITAVTADGTVAIGTDGQPQTTVHMVQRPGADPAYIGDAISQWIKPFFLACSFLAADNVEVVERKPKTGGRRKSRPFTSYHTINVYPAKRRYTSGESSAPTGGQGKARRKPFIGHFRRYGYGGRGLLFGKYKKIVYVEGKPDDVDREVRLPGED